MEVVEEPPLLTEVPSGEEVNNLNDKDEAVKEGSVQVDIVINSNGDAESKPLQEDLTSSTEVSYSLTEVSSVKEEIASNSKSEENASTTNCENEPEGMKNEAAESNTEASVVGEKQVLVIESIEYIDAPDTENTTNKVEPVVEESVVEVDGIVETTEDNVTFETEILVESNVTEFEENLDKDKYDESNNAILSDLDQNIDFTEVLRSSDVSENVENNNCEQEVFNKEELLDILEGNDTEQVESRKLISENFQEESKKLEKQLALQQLSRLQSKRSKNKKLDKKTTNKRMSKNEEILKKVDETTDDINMTQEDPLKEDSKADTSNDELQKSKEENIVNELVKDWEDDEHTENEVSRKLRKSTEKNTKNQPETVESNNDESLETHLDGLNSSTSKSGDESQPQRRFGRVIKKKVIFDPDNPDTFTKIKTTIKKETVSDKEQTTPTPPKKIKPDQTPIRSKSKSPVNKLQWKKPTPKTSKQHKRLTEIDKLLMDEGAVNMICQLTPEAPKGKKNMKSKAEFIKKIQSNTPGTKEMKFRERKKEFKTEDGEPKKIGAEKLRLSLSSSVKSPSVCDDFEAHSADDSIIYRRHSSSSYSSSCMSPRRLSDVEGNSNQPVAANVIQNLVTDTQNVKQSNNSNESLSTDVFVKDINTSTPAKEIMNKRDCLSIKEKLNSKLSQVLNKRKRDSNKSEKPSKLKKISSHTANAVGDNKYISVIYKDKVAEISFGKSGSLYNIQMLQELYNVLAHVNSLDNVNVILFILEETLGSGIDLVSILKDEKIIDHAQGIAEVAKCIQSTLAYHSKLTCFGVNGQCGGFNLALVALCDLVIAGEVATFSLVEQNGVLLQPGVAALQESCLSHNLVNDMVIFGKKLSASEALHSGLVSRVIWPERFVEQVRGIAKDLAAQQPENLKVKKQLLGLKRKSDFMASIEKEQEHLVKYWTSPDGLEILRSNLNSA